MARSSTAIQSEIDSINAEMIEMITKRDWKSKDQQISHTNHYEALQKRVDYLRTVELPEALLAETGITSIEIAD